MIQGSRWNFMDEYNKLTSLKPTPATLARSLRRDSYYWICYGGLGTYFHKKLREEDQLSVRSLIEYGVLKLTDDEISLPYNEVGSLVFLKVVKSP